jgi:biopolymer transport protein ExbD
MPKSKVFASGPAGDITFNVVPLIDVTFVLILFLILTSQIARESYAELLLPKPLNAQVLTDPNIVDATNHVIVNVISKASLKEKEDNPVIAAQAKEYQINLNSISVGDTDAMKRVFIKKREACKSPEFYVDIRADKRVQYFDIKPIMKAAEQAGILKVNIAALSE